MGLRHRYGFGTLSALVLLLLYLGSRGQKIPQLKDMYAAWMPGQPRPTEHCLIEYLYYGLYGETDAFKCILAGEPLVIAYGYGDQIDLLALYWLHSQVGDVMLQMPPYHRLKRLGVGWSWEWSAGCYLTSARASLTAPALTLVFFEEIP